MPPVSSCPDGGGPKRLRLGVVVPTRDGGAALLRVAPLPKGAGSVLSSIGDFRPLAGSTRCADLTGATGPIARVTGRPPGGFDFGFDRAPDADRSWEAAVVFTLLALRSEDVDLVEPAAAEIVAVVRGSVDAELALGNDGAGVADRTSTERWSAVLAEPSRRVVRIGAVARSGADAPDDATGEGGDRLDVATVERILRPRGGETARPRGRSRVPAIAVVAVAAVGLAIAGLRLRTSDAVLPPPPAGPSVEQGTPSTGGGETRPVDPASDPVGAAVAEAFRVRLLAAPAGRRCEEVVFGAVDPVVTVLAPSPTVLDLAGRSEVCGLDVASTVTERRIEARLSPSMRPGAIEHSVETIDGKNFARLRLFFGHGLRRSAGFDVVAVAAGEETVATLVVRPPER